MRKTFNFHSTLIVQVTIIATILLNTLAVCSQIESRNSIEFDLEEGFKGQEIYGVGINGFVLSTKTDEEQIRHFNEWKFHLFDTSFSRVYTKSQFISDHLTSYQQFATNQISHNCYLSTNGDYLLNTFIIENFNLETVKGTFPIKGKVANMASSSQFAWFSYETKSGWYLISVDWMTGQQNVFPISINDVKRKNLRLKKIQVLEEESKLILFVQANKNKMVSTTYAMFLKFSGEILNTVPLNFHDDENIISVSAKQCSTNEYVFTGSYSTEKVEQITEGLFFIQTIDGRIKVKNYIDYDNLKGFSEMSAINYRAGYHAALHDLVATDSGYVLVAEMFYPRYTLDVNNVPVYIGNTYTHFSILGFDTAGVLKWDQTLELKLNEITLENEGVVRVLQTKNKPLTFAYAEGNFYAISVLDLASRKVSDPKFFMMNKRDPSVSNLWFNANIIVWYDDCFLFFSTRDKKVRIEGKGRKIESIFISKER